MRLLDWLLGRRKTLTEDEGPDPAMDEVRRLVSKRDRREERLATHLRQLETRLQKHR
jgi:hypothetical protein